MFIIAGILVLILYIVSHYNLASAVLDENLKEKLSQKLHTRVEIGDIEVNWLNQVALNDVVIFDQSDDTLFSSRRAMIALEVVPLFEKKLIINSIQIIDFRLSARKDSLPAKTNYDFLVEALMPKADKTDQRHFINDISLHSLLLRQGIISYDVLDQPHNTNRDIPDINHIFLHQISASLTLNVSHITGMDFILKRLKLKERSGLSLDEFHAEGNLNGDGLTISDIGSRFSTPLLNGSRGIVAMQGNYLQADGRQALQLRTIKIDARHLGKIRSRLLFESRLFDHQNYAYQIDFLPSHINPSLLRHFAQNLGINVNDSLLTELQTLDFIYWEGCLQGRSDSLITYQGSVETTGILNSSFNVQTEYCPKSSSPLSLVVEGNVDDYQMQHHLYKDISIRGSYRNNTVHASFNSRDPLCRLKGTSNISIHKNNCHLTGIVDVEHIDPFAMHLTETTNLADIAFGGFASFDVTIPTTKVIQTKWFDTATLPNGYLHVDSLSLISGNDTLRFGTLRVSLDKEQQTPVFTIVSASGNVVATPTSIIGFIPVNQQLARILKLPGNLGKDMNFQSNWDSVAKRINFEVSIPQWIEGSNEYSLYIEGTGGTDSLSPLPTHIEAKTDFKIKTANHSIGTLLSLTYDPDPMQIRVKSSDIAIDDKTYHTSDALISRKENGAFQLERLIIQEENQRLNVSGTLGRSSDIDLHFGLQNWQLDFFFDLLQKGYLDFGGYATGNLHLNADPFLHLKTDSLQVSQFSYIGTKLGTNTLSCDLDLENTKLAISADVESYPSHATHIECDIRLHEIKDTIDLKFDLDSLPLNFLSYWIGGVLNDLEGHGSGDVHIFGDVDSLNLLGHPLLQNVNFTNKMLGARFYVTDILNLESDKSGRNGFIGLNNVSVRDKNGQKAILTLDLEHHHLHDMEYGLDIDIPESPAGFLVFDHPTQQQGDLYWGQLWATGRCQMHGNYNHHRISMQASTAGRSIFNLSPGEENFTDDAYNFLSFRDKNALQEETDTLVLYSKTLFDKTEEDPVYVEADLLIHANEHCQVYVQMDPLAEDRLVCKGNGDLALHYDPHHDINLTGNYDISSGSYTVTMKGDFMTKAFQLQPGSNVFFPGSPSDAELDLKALYNVPSVNLKDLDESFETMTSLSRTTLPVDCKLNVTGQITAPQIAFDLEVKNTSDEVQALVHNIIGTQEMLNREVFYLLLFSKFYTPEYASTSQRQTGSELTSFASSSLTSQLNNLLGHMSDNFTLGTNFRSEKGDFSDMEMDVSVSTRLLNERLLMTGNLGYRDADKTISMNNQARTFIGDFDVEFLINTRGTVRAKAYSHYNDRDYSINNALTTQGIGIILRKDFKSFKDLLKRKQEVAK